MSFSMADNQNVLDTPMETDASGNNVPIVPANLSWSSDDPTIATVAIQPNGQGLVTGVKAGSCHITVKDNQFNLSDTDSAQPPKPDERVK